LTAHQGQTNADAITQGTSAEHSNVDTKFTNMVGLVQDAHAANSGASCMLQLGHAQWHISEKLFASDQTAECRL